jgi:hypothetical protein
MAFAAGMTINVPNFSGGRTVPKENVLDLFGCTGKNQSPAISWSGEPRGTQGFALTSSIRTLYGQRLVALDGVRHPGERAQPAGRCR